MKDFFIHQTAMIEKGVVLESGTKIWANSHVREGSIIGPNVTIGESVYIGPGVKIGASTKIQNGSQIYEPSIVGDGVFVGPGVILTNDKIPRAVGIDGEPKSDQDWEKSTVILEDGCSVGAGSVCVAPVRIGRYALVAAGSVVVKDVKDYELVAGNPAKHMGWVDEEGARLSGSQDEIYVSSAGIKFQLTPRGLRRILD